MSWRSWFRRGGRESGHRTSDAGQGVGRTGSLLDSLPAGARALIRIGVVPVTEPGDFGRSSGFGGQPHLPDGVEHPICPQCGQPITLVAQIVIDDLPDEARPIGSGVLQVFYCTNEPEGQTPCDVLLEGWEAFSEAHVVRVIPNLPGASSMLGSPFPPRRVERWVPVRECPTGEELKQLGIELDIPAWDALADSNIPSVGEKVGGWPAWVQGVEYPTCPRCGATMDFLVQIDSQHNVPITFGDMGTGHVTRCPNDEDVLAFAWACY